MVFHAYAQINGHIEHFILAVLLVETCKAYGAARYYASLRKNETSREQWVLSACLLTEMRITSRPTFVTPRAPHLQASRQLSDR